MDNRGQEMIEELRKLNEQNMENLLKNYQLKRSISKLQEKLKKATENN